MHSRYGPPDAVRIAEVDKPSIGDHDVLVRVHATTVNRTDCAYRAARPFFVRTFTGLARPRRAVLGTEYAGVVEAVGSGVTAFTVGDRVFGYNEGAFGTHAYQYVETGQKSATSSSPSYRRTDLSRADYAHGMTITYEWRGIFDNAGVGALHAEGFDHPPVDVDWLTQVHRHSLGWVCARRDGELVGFVNVAWDGGVHAFILDTVVSGALRRSGIGAGLVAVAAREACAAKCEWLHVDFEDDLRAFYYDACGFEPTNAGLVAL